MKFEFDLAELEYVNEPVEDRRTLRGNRTFQLFVHLRLVIGMAVFELVLQLAHSFCVPECGA